MNIDIVELEIKRIRAMQAKVFKGIDCLDVSDMEKGNLKKLVGSLFYAEIDYIQRNPEDYFEMEYGDKN